MKMYMIVYDAGYDEDVIETLSSLGIKGYTKWTKVLGKGEKSDPKMDDGIWPGYNSTIMMTVNMAQETGVKQALKNLYENLRSRGIRVFSWPINQIL
jgi:hypothetical protein